jgi:hypothetical protein
VAIAADVCSVTGMACLAAHSPLLIMPRLMVGVPRSRILGKRGRPFLPWSVRAWIRAKQTRIFDGPKEQRGFRTPKGRTHPISHPTPIPMLARDRVRPKPGIARVEGKTVHCVDATAGEIATIIAATGSVTALPVLPEADSPVRDSDLHLQNRADSPKRQNLNFIGFCDVTGGSNIRMMDDQAECICGDRRRRDQAARSAGDRAGHPRRQGFPGEHAPSPARRVMRRNATRCAAASCPPGIISAAACGTGGLRRSSGCCPGTRRRRALSRRAETQGDSDKAIMQAVALPPSRPAPSPGAAAAPRSMSLSSGCAGGFTTPDPRGWRTGGTGARRPAPSPLAKPPRRQ